jgi:hypothetical protein
MSHGKSILPSCLAKRKLLAKGSQHIPFNWGAHQKELMLGLL